MDKSNSKKRRWIYYLIFIVCILVLFVLIILFFMEGSTKIEGSGDVESVESVVCDGTNISYPFFNDDGVSEKTIKINILTSRKKLDTINLVYSVKYSSEDSAEKARVNNHTSLNKSFSNDSLEVDSFDARFVNNGNKLQMTLSADSKKINGISAKYFLINGSHDMTIDTLTKNYNNQGLDCVINNKS